MVQINFASREVNCKIVYYGPGRCGKTTNLQVVHAKAPKSSTGELVSIATETDRTLFFDFLPLDLGTVAGMRTKFQLYTVPGQVYYDATRKLVLQGCDGIVFVADSNPEMEAENIESLDNLAKNLAENGLDMMDLPLVLQYNKRDIPNPMPVAEMSAQLNRNKWPEIEAVAVNGDGVFQTLKAISQQVIRRLNREQGYTDDGANRPGKPGVVAATKPPPSAIPKPPPPPAAPPTAQLPPPPPAPPPAPAKAQLAAGSGRHGRIPAAPAKESNALGAAVGMPAAAALTKTQIFRGRMAEIKKQQAAASSALQEAVSVTPDTPPTKKKGCLGLFVIGIIIMGGMIVESLNAFI